MSVDPRTSAIQTGSHRIEYHQPDLTLAYATVAPLITEAHAMFECGEPDKARETIAKARGLVEAVTMTSVTIETVNKPVSG